MDCSISASCLLWHIQIRRSEMRIVYVVLVTMVLSACNTMSGLGEDIQRGGQKLENQAEKAKK